jgi:hypothetical protein
MPRRLEASATASEEYQVTAQDVLQPRSRNVSTV